MNVIKGKIIKNISNTYIVKSDNTEFEATARGKLKTLEIKPVVGDNVEFDIVDGNFAVITKILERKNYLKRPNVSNISQIMFVVATLNPKPNFLMLDKEMALAEFLDLKSILVINKVDLDEKEAERIADIYTKSGYEIIKVQADSGFGIRNIENALRGHTSVLAGASGVRKVYYYK